MARLGTVAVLGILALVAGCGSSDENDNARAANTSAGTAGAGTAGARATVAGGAGGQSITEPVGGAGSVGSGTQSFGGSANLVGGAMGIAGAAVTGGSVSNAGAAGATPAGGAAGTCNYPACLYELFSACPAAPTTASCTTQDTTNTTTRQTSTCYGDGSAATSIMNLATYASTMTFKKGGATCYTMEVSISTSGEGVPTSAFTTLKNGAGNVVATEVWDVATDKTTVTCTGAQPVVLNAACDATSSGTYNCQPGICNP